MTEVTDKNRNNGNTGVARSPHEVPIQEADRNKPSLAHLPPDILVEIAIRGDRTKSLSSLYGLRTPERLNNVGAVALSCKALRDASLDPRSALSQIKLQRAINKLRCEPNCGSKLIELFHEGWARRILAQCTSLDLSRLGLTNTEMDQLASIFDQVKPQQLQKLDLGHNQFTADKLALWADKGFLDNVSELSLNSVPWRAHGFDLIEFLQNPRARRIFLQCTSLNLSELGLTNTKMDQLAAIFEQDKPQRLQKLYLGRNDFTADKLTLWADKGFLDNVSELSLKGFPWRAHGFDLIEFLQNPRARRIFLQCTSLNLWGLGLDNTKMDRLAAIFEQDKPQRLQKLDLGNNVITIDKLALLAEKGFLDNVSELSLDHCRTANENWALITFIAQWPQFSNLTFLNLCGLNMEDEGVRVLAGSTNLSNLKHLMLESNGISDEGVRVLAGSTNLSNLKYLGLGYNRIGNSGFQKLCKSRSLVSLESLELSHNSLTRDSLGHLARSKELKSLKDLSLQVNPMDRGNLGYISKYYFGTRPNSLRKVILDAEIRGIKQLKRFSRYKQAEFITQEEFFG